MILKMMTTNLTITNMASKRDRIREAIENYLNCSVKIEEPNSNHPNMTIYSAYFNDDNDYSDNCNKQVDRHIAHIFAEYGGSLFRADTNAAKLCIWWMMEE